MTSVCQPSQLVSVGHRSFEACSVVEHIGESGKLKGRPYAGGDIFIADPLHFRCFFDILYSTTELDH